MMKLIRVYNGFTGESSVRIDIIAESTERAIEIARPLYAKESNNPRYSLNLEAVVIFDDCSKEQASDIRDC